MTRADRGEWSAKAQASEIGPLRAAVGEFAARHGASGAAVDLVRLCVSEAVTNAVVHGYADRDEPGSVTVTAEVRADVLAVHVRDDGVGLAPRVDSPGIGLGLPLIGELAGGLTVTAPAEGGTDVGMRFALADAEAPARPPFA